MNGGDNPLDTRALGDALAGLLSAPAQLVAGLAGSLANVGSSGCRIPPPCWEPQPAGKCTLTLAPGCSGTIRVHVSNCDWSPRVIGLTAMGKIAGWMKFEPTTMAIGPQEQGTFVVTVHVPDKVQAGETISGPLLVRGCIDHFVRVEVRIADCAGCTRCDVSVRDCADHIHHWYDHFYCPRPCRNTRTPDLKNG
ncbi:MAG TPA: hypothetical protein VJ997_07205 [Longimicrobiales bacterium]|nr:hypothetical protein [Longimicrobiales bacterium]